MYLQTNQNNTFSSLLTNIVKELSKPINSRSLQQAAIRSCPAHSTVGQCHLNTALRTLN